MHPPQHLPILVGLLTSFLPASVHGRTWQEIPLLHDANTIQKYESESSMPSSSSSSSFHFKAELLYEVNPFSIPSPGVPSSSTSGNPLDDDNNNNNNNNNNRVQQHPNIFDHRTPNEKSTRIPFVEDPKQTQNVPSANDIDVTRESPLEEEEENDENNIDDDNDDEDLFGLSDSVRFPENPVPINPPIEYFNYDMSRNALYGPGFPTMVRTKRGLEVRYQSNAWKFIRNPRKNSDNHFYWKEFMKDGFGPWKGTLQSRNLNDNQCGNIGRQSPIDIRLSGVACVEHHQIRTLPGDFRVSGSNVDKRIEHNKLRLVWRRRPCRDYLDSKCAEPDPPHSDFPNGWGGFADAMHLDFKLPSEHRIYGLGFDAEMQIFHLHPGRKRLPAISVLMRAIPGRHNARLQPAIDAFQLEYDMHLAECGNLMRKNRRLLTSFYQELFDNRNDASIPESDSNYDQDLFANEYHKNWAEFSTNLDNPDFLERRDELSRRLNEGIFDPYHFDLMPTYWFFGYDGSLTEPPCSEIVSWFVMDSPMIISTEQLDQLKTILFTHVDPQCRRTSTHFNGSVARPIQESAGREVWRCTRDDYIPDHERNT